jgi:gas vesicle structural protein
MTYPPRRDRLTDLPAPDGFDELDGAEELVLGDLLNHVLDKGVVIQGNVTISIANIDLVQVDLRLMLSSVETIMRRVRGPGDAGA